MKNWKDIVSAMILEIGTLRARGIRTEHLLTTLDIIDAMVFEESGENEDPTEWYELIAALRRQLSKEVAGN